MAPSGGLILSTGPDSERSYSPEEELRLTTNLRSLAAEIEDGEFKTWRIDRHLLCELHRRFFDGVREHAGRHRRDGQGTEYLSFGPHRSVHRSKVEAALDRICEDTRKLSQQFYEYPDDPHYELQALKLAVKFHADYIQIHPFEDGNGRTGRLLVDLVMVSLSLVPVAVEVPKQEYLAVLNHYYLRNDMQPLLDLYLGLVSAQLPARSELPPPP